MAKKAIKYSAIAILSEIYIFDNIGYPAVIDFSSMEPTLIGTSRKDSYFNFKDIVWVNRLNKNPKKFDVIAFTNPFNRNAMMIKRISGVEGELAHFTKINDGMSFLIPQNFLCVKSDNRNMNVGTDSSTFGPVSKSLVIGKVTHIIWPPSRWRKLT